MKNIPFHLILLWLLIVLILSSCEDLNCIRGNGDVVTRELQLNSFNSFELKGSGNVYLTQGDSQKVIIEGESNILDLIETDVREQRWDIEFSECVRSHKDIKVYITIPEVRSGSISGSGDIIGENDFSGGNMGFKISGSGNIDVSAVCEEMLAIISGSGGINLKGQAREFTGHISGSGDIRAYPFFTKNAEIKISGSGDVEISASETLEVNISGSGDVRYHGSPVITTHVSGSGNVSNTD